MTAALIAAALHSIVATEYHHTFSAAHAVLARVRPGDTIVTKTVDSAGFDYQGIRRTKTHGNPLTGPFFVEGAEPGDTLAVTITRLRLNRATGYTGYNVGVKDLPPALRGPKPAAGAVIAGYDYLVPWVIDLAANTVRPKDQSTPALPAQPMLGCIGVAPEGDYSPRSGPAAYWGGNLDYNRIREGATVLLPVHHPGALLFVGDGHALQGDGEPLGSGVETSLDVEMTVQLRKGRKLSLPRLETAAEFISIGARPDVTLNDSIGLATADMLGWLIDERGFTPAAAHLLIGVQARYDVLTLGGYVALRLPR